MSSSMSTEKPIQAAFQKQVADFLRTSAEKEEASHSASESYDNTAGTGSKDIGAAMD